MKPLAVPSKEQISKVTPFVGVWIETKNGHLMTILNSVTPFVGVWIETFKDAFDKFAFAESHPSWVCGLKLASPVSAVRL